MPRITAPADIVDAAMDRLERLVTNLLLENRNFTSPEPGRTPHHFEATPRTPDFVRTTLASMAGSILERVRETRQLAVRMAADAEVPGLARSHAGRIRDHDVRVHESDGGWVATLSVPDAFHAGDDLEARFPDETSALDAVREYANSGVLDEAFAPVADHAPSPR